MKTFFILLLLTNIVFALLQWLFPYDQLFGQTRPIVASEQLQLVDEAQQAVASRIEKASTQRAQNQKKPAAPQQLCYTLGPFKDEKQAQEVVLKFRQNKLNMITRPSVEQEYLGMMVYIGGFDSRQQAIQAAESLAAKGIRDYMIVNEEGKSNALSLGVFGLKKNADRRVTRISQLGYEAQSEARYRDRTIYWLDYNKPEPQPLAELIDRLKIEQGVSRISRLCS